MADTQTVPNAMRVECEECGAVKVIFLPKLPASPVAVPAPAEERLSVLEEIARDEAIIERAVRVGAYFQDWRLASLAAKKGHRACVVTTAGDFVVLTDLQDMALRNPAKPQPSGDTELPEFKVTAEDQTATMTWDVPGAHDGWVPVSWFAMRERQLRDYKAKYEEAQRTIANEPAWLAAINWACGCGADGFEPPDPPESTGRYWWRAELVRRAGLVYNGERYVIGGAR